MHTQKHLSTLLYFVLLVVLLPVALRGQSHVPVVEYMKQITGTALTTSPTATVENERYFNSAYSVNIDTPYPVQNVVTFRLDEGANAYFPAAFTATVKLRITYTNGALQTNYIDRDFSINFDPAGAHKTRDMFVFNGAHRVTVAAINPAVTSADASITTQRILPFLIVENKMQVQPKYKFNCATTVTGMVVTDSARVGADELYVSWNEVTGAHEYDLEWVYVDKTSLLANRYGNPVNTALLFTDNASRVSIAGTRYAIPLMYNDEGTLFIRVRPVQYSGEQRYEAAWGTGAGAGQYVYTGHERDLNWQSTVSFAEEGKRKVVVQYFDGSLRGRQTVTKDNTSNNTVVAESFYDYQGRPAINVMPVPTLNSVIGYTRLFNVGINGAEYEKSSFDSITSGGTLCNTAAPAMGVQSGAARYYSSSNPDKSGLNSYIPDAEGYPFTQTQFTHDGSGRVAQQSGVGGNYKIAGGHDTRYYYSTPSQEELDALFGTEVGDHNHYFKQAVQDANGQMAVTYTDMHGRTVATALAGDAPASLNPLQSYNVVEKTEDLIDASGAIFRDKTIEHKKSLLVQKGGVHNFHYQLNPETMIKEACAVNGGTAEQVCYSCLYDLRITVTNDCNSEMLYEKTVRNFSLNDIKDKCTADGFNVAFQLNLAPGTYAISKQLSISSYGMDYYREKVFLPKNTCKTLEEVIAEQRSIVNSNTDCVPGCEACRAELDSWFNFKVQYNSEAGISGDTTAAWAAYQEALAACNALCNTNSEADDTRMMMLQDVTPPFGQYANLQDTTSEYSIFYHSGNNPYSRFQQESIQYLNATGKPDYVTNSLTGSEVTPNKLGAKEFTATFQDSWAEALLPLHPEYCKLQRLQTYGASSAWDRAFDSVDTYALARERGFLNPTGLSTVSFPWVSGNTDPLTSAYPQLESKLKVYVQNQMIVNGTSGNRDVSMWAMATMITRLQSNDTTGMATCLVHPFESMNLCEGDLDMAWRTFRSLYRQAKREIVSQLVNSGCGSTASSSTLLNAKFTPRFALPAELMESNGYGYTLNQNASPSVMQDTANAILNRQYEENCRSYAKMWMEQLAPCQYTEDDLNVILPLLMAVCKEGSDAKHPYGSSTVKPSSTITYRSFEQVVREYNQQHNKGGDIYQCNPELITSPQPYDRPASYGPVAIVTRPEDCQCSTLQTLYAAYQQQTSSFSSFSAYVKSARNADMTDADLYKLLSMCTASAADCRYLAKPIMVPPGLQCGMEHLCTDCAEYDSVYQRFVATYPTVTPSMADTTDAQHQANQLFSSFMNNRLGLGKEAWQYLAFKQQCDSSVNGYTRDCSADKVIARSYDTHYGTSSFSHVQRSADNGYLLAGQIEDMEGVQRGYVVKTDNAGRIQWSKTYGSNAGASAFTKIARDRDSGYVLIGSTTAYDGEITGPGTGKNKVLITRITEKGNVMWSKVIGGTAGGEQGRDVKALSNGSYAFAGGYNYVPGSADQLVGVISKTGVISWMKRVGSNSSDDGGSLAEYGDTLLLTGETYLAKGTNTKFYDGALYKLNKYSGDVYKMVLYNIDNKCNYFGAVDSVAGGYRITNINSSDWGITSNNNVIALNVNGNGTVASYKSFKPLPAVGQAQGHNLISVPGDGFVMAQVPYSSPRDLYFTRVNGAGSTVASNRVQIPGEQNIYGNYRNADGSIAVVGANGLYGMFMLLDADAHAGCNDTTVVIGDTTNNISADTTFAPQVNVSLSTTVMDINLSTDYITAVPGSTHTDSVVCKGCVISNTKLKLCGSLEGIFAQTTAPEEINNCSDSAFFIESKAMELYKIYMEGLKGSFEHDYVAKCMDAYKYESFTVTRSVSEYHYTLYYYNQAGLLAKTVPPAGVHENHDANWLQQVREARANNTRKEADHTMVTWYEYNTLNQVVKQQTPDAGVSQFWYDRLGRFAISQNAEQLKHNQYSYTLFDQLGRIKQAGQLTSNIEMRDDLSRSDVSLQLWLDAAAASREQIIVTTYDERYAGNEEKLAATNLRNRISYNQAYNTAADLTAAGNPYASATFYSYDVHGNVDTLLQNYKRGVMAENGNDFKRIEYQYDLISGKVNRVAYQPGRQDAFYHRYSYDAENRLTNVETSRDDIYWENEAWYAFYKHGPLARTVIGQQQVQGLDYVYTLQGWVKAVNPSVLSTGGATGSGDGCGLGTAVDNLVIDVRLANGPSVYTARQTVTFTDGFDSNGEQFESKVDNSLITCIETGGYSPDGTALNAPMKDELQYVLHYNNTDYKPIGGLTPDILVPEQLGSEYRPLYNGNISGMGVNISKLNSPLWYLYRYDQLSRLTQVDTRKCSNTVWSGLADNGGKYHEGIVYGPNGNIISYQRNAGGTAADDKLVMDNLEYHYASGNNRLDYIYDHVLPGKFDGDIDEQSSGNYKYDEIGNLTDDKKEKVSNIIWTVYGKIKSLQTEKATIAYTYDGAGNRISKTVTTTVLGEVKVETTWYVRDMRGNVVGIYSKGKDEVNSGHLSLLEQDIYGNSRLGILVAGVDVSGEESLPVVMPQLGSGKKISFVRGQKFFELNNHLGNVLATVSDRRVQVGSGSTLNYYTADVISAQDYYPFGMLQPDRVVNANGYRYGFNGQEKSIEINTDGNNTTAEFWQYDARIGRRWNLDPVALASESEYVVNGNNPNFYVDPYGSFKTKVAAKLYAFFNGGKVSKQADNTGAHSGEWRVSKKAKYTGSGGGVAVKVDYGPGDPVAGIVNWVHTSDFVVEGKVKVNAGIQLGISGTLWGLQGKAEAGIETYDGFEAKYDFTELDGDIGMSDQKVHNFLGIEVKLFDDKFRIGGKYDYTYSYYNGYYGPQKVDGSGFHDWQISVFKTWGPKVKYADETMSRVLPTQLKGSANVQSVSGKKFYGVDVGIGLKAVLGVDVKLKVGVNR